MTLLLAYCGWIVAGWEGVQWILFGGVLMFVLMRQVRPELLLRALRARPVGRDVAPELHDVLDELCLRAGVAAVPGLYRVWERSPLAMTVGEGEEATIVLSDGLIEALSLRELAGILAHEIVHLRNHDLALTRLAIVVAMLTRLITQFGLLLIFVSLLLRAVAANGLPILPLLALVAAPIGVSLLQLALSRAREREADLQAAELTGDPRALAAALAKIRHAERMLLQGRFRGAVPIRLPALLRTHPATEDRIRRLLAMADPDEA